MKNILILILSISFITLSCSAQIVPVQNAINYQINDSGIPDGTYLKDIDNLFNKFIGTWVGSHNNISYEIVVSKLTEQYLGISEDLLLMKYKVTDASGNQLINTTQLPNNSSRHIKGTYFLTNRETYQLNYGGEQAMCGQNGNILIAVVNNGNQLNFYYDVNGQMFPENCPNGPAEQILPANVSVTFNKQ